MTADRYQTILDYPLIREEGEEPLQPLPFVDLRYGAKGYRDPENLCEAFDPTENIDMLGMRVTAPGTGDCHSDGHYLCRGCLRMSRDSFDLEEEEIAFYDHFERGSKPLRLKVIQPKEDPTRFEREPLLDEE